MILIRRVFLHAHRNASAGQAREHVRKPDSIARLFSFIRHEPFWPAGDISMTGVTFFLLSIRLQNRQGRPIWRPVSYLVSVTNR